MAAAAALPRLDYIAPWWTYWLHTFPHRTFSLQPADNTFRPAEESYQQALILLACAGAAGLGLSLLVLTAYLSCLCCCRRAADDEVKRPSACCVTWAAILSGVLICSAVGVGFYGNSETNDGVYQLTHSLYSANHTLGGINHLHGDGLKQHLERLDEIFAARWRTNVQALRFMQQMAGNIMAGLPAATDPGSGHLPRHLLGARQALALAAHHGTSDFCVSPDKFIGTSDFCVSPDKFIVNQTKDFLSADVAHYYLFCSPNLPSPFQQSLTIYQRSLTTMQIQIQGLLRFSIPLFPTAERDLLGIQRILNSTEANLHQLTAFLDCHGLHKPLAVAAAGARRLPWLPRLLL
ncbi:hypothetical protein CRUP_023980 [Coryphaenoides rupestris]|nr:hypothetical protein CRUP_023980 [Coryphaenoides rupestris]